MRSIHATEIQIRMEMIEPNTNWLTLYTKPKLERRVCDALQARNVEAYLPVVLQFSTHLRQREHVPFFPCYLFAQVDPESTAYAELAWTPGLRRVVRFDGRPAWLPAAVIAGLREHLDELERHGYFSPGCKFQPGDRVRIQSGPLKDLDAVFDRALSKEGRVRILLNFIGRFTACEVEASCLSRVA